MSGIAFISDIHSNYSAFKTVYAEIKRRGIDEIYCLGDIVGYHTMPNEVIDFLRSSNIICIKGNHDNDVLNKKFKDKQLDIFRWTYDCLSRENLEWLTSLSESMEIFIGDYKAYLCHGSPDSIEEYMYKDSERTEVIAKSSMFDIIVCAHTHIPYFSKIEDKYIVNSGSVGKPKIGRPNATFAILTDIQNTLECEIVELSYDFDEIYHKTLNAGFKKSAEALRTGIV